MNNAKKQKKCKKAEKQDKLGQMFSTKYEDVLRSLLKNKYIHRSVKIMSNDDKNMDDDTVNSL